MRSDQPTPPAPGFRFPAEWEMHRATWLSLPQSNDSWPHNIEQVYDEYFELIRLISEGEKVALNIHQDEQRILVENRLRAHGIDPNQVELYLHPTNDCWCRDHGPIFLANERKEKVMVNWEFNAWGNKYPHDLDNQIPEKIAAINGLPLISPGIVMEGGSLETNGAGTLLTTEACLLNRNRNPHLSTREIEDYLKSFLGIQQVLWLADGIVGDDTDGHIDDIARFVGRNTVATVVEKRRSSPNHAPLQHNLQLLRSMRLPDGSPLEIIELPMPDDLFLEGEQLPASYANFYLCNRYVIVPTFGCKQDEEALGILEDCFTDRKVVGLSSKHIIHGLGSFHCLTQQEPL